MQGTRGEGEGGEKGVRRGRNRTDPAYRQRVRRERDKDSHESREKEKGLRSQGLDLKRALNLTEYVAFNRNKPCGGSNYPAV